MLESVTKNVTVHWRPARFPVRWADGPDDVPPFDPSRGGDPYRGRIQAEYLTVSTQYLGGGADPPPWEWESAVELDDSGDVMLVSGANYPRVVRASEAELVADDGIDEDPLTALSGLADQEDSKQFMHDVLRVAERYGLLSFAEEDATLEAWRCVAIELRAHTQLLKRLQVIRDDNPVGQGKSFIDPDDRDALSELLGSVNPDRAAPRRHDVLGAIREAADLDELRSRLADLYWKAFGHQLRMYGHGGGFWAKTRMEPKLWALPVDVAGPGQLVVRTGSRGWSLYQLWRIAVANSPIRVCRGCEGLFLPQRRDAMHCSDACRMRTYRRRRAAGSVE